MVAVAVGGRLLRGVLYAGAFRLNVAQDVGTMLHPLHPRLKENDGQFFNEPHGAALSIVTKYC